MRALPALPLLVTACVLLGSSAAHARNGGLYLELAPSWQFFLHDDEVKVEEGDDSLGPEDAFFPVVKLGVNLFGWAGAEAQFTGHYWGIGSDPGGAGYVGGVFRVTPLEALTFVIPEDFTLPSLIPAGPVSWTDRPFDLGISIGGGYTMIGEDFAYQGGFFQWGVDLKFFITPNLAIGLDLPFRHMLYDPFRYTDYADSLGFCTDGGQAYGLFGGQRVDVGDGPRGTYPVPEMNANDIDECDEPAPSAVLFSPAITISGVFDFGI